MWKTKSETTIMMRHIVVEDEAYKQSVLTMLELVVKLELAPYTEVSMVVAGSRSAAKSLTLSLAAEFDEPVSAMIDAGTQSEETIREEERAFDEHASALELSVPPVLFLLEPDIATAILELREIERQLTNSEKMIREEEGRA